MKFFILSIAVFLCVSCGNTQISTDTDTKAPDATEDNDTIFNDDDIEEISDHDSTEIGEQLTVSVRSIEDDYDPSSDIIFGDSIGNLYYSKTAPVTMLRNASFTKEFLKFNSDGIFQWQLPFDFPMARALAVYDYTFSEISGSIYIVGAGDFETTEKMFLIKISADGFQSWVRFWGTGEWGFPFSLDIDSEDNVYVAGGVRGSFDGDNIAGSCAASPPCYDAFVTKWNTDGNLLWNKQSGKEKSDLVQGLVVDEDNNLILVGTENIDRDFSSNGSNLGTSMFLRKWNSDGDQMWEVSQKESENIIYGTDVDIMDGDIVVLGHKCLSPIVDYCHNQLYAEKFNSRGEKLWEKRWRGKGTDKSVATAVRVNVENNQIFTISDAWEKSGTNSDIMITILNTHGDIELKQIIKTQCQDYSQHISVLPEGIVMITGISDGWIGEDLSTAECECESFKPFVMILTPSE